MAVPRRGNAGDLSAAVIAALILALILLFRFQGPFSFSSGPAAGVQHPADSVSEDGLLASSFSAPPPAVTARAFVVVEGSCGATVYGHNAHQRLPPASLVKLATALVAVERGEPAALVRIDVDGPLLAQTTGSTIMGLQPGMEMRLLDLLYGLLLPSGNDAALAIAEYIAGSTPAFVELMNQRAEEMGLEDTHFVNPHGLDDPGLYSSAYDLAMLGRQFMANPLLAQIVRTRKWQPAWEGDALVNDNGLLEYYPGLDGVKIGLTERAGQTMVVSAERGGRRLFVTVLGSRDRYGDVSALLDWAFTSTSSSCTARAP